VSGEFFKCRFVIVMTSPLVVQVSDGSSMFATLPQYERDAIRIRSILSSKSVATEIRAYLLSKTGSLPDEDVCALSRALVTEKERDLKNWFRGVKAKLDSTGPVTSIVGPTANVMAAPEVVNMTRNGSALPTVRVSKDGSPRKVYKSRNATKKTVRFVDEDKETLMLVMRLGNKIRSGFTKLVSFITTTVEFVDSCYVLHCKAPTDVLKNRYTCVAVLLLFFCLMYFVVLPTVILAPTQFVYGVVADFCSQEFGFYWTTFTPGTEVLQQMPLISDGGEGENGKILSDYKETMRMEDDLSAIRAGLAGKTSSSSIISDTNMTQETLSMYMEAVSGFEKEYVSPEPMGKSSVTPSVQRLRLKNDPFVGHGRFSFPPLKERMPGRDPEVVALQKKVADLEDRLRRVVRVLEEGVLAEEKEAAEKQIEEEHSHLNWNFGALMGVIVVTGMVVAGRPVVAHALAQTTTFCMGFWAWGSISVTDFFTLGSFIFIDSVDDIDYYV